MVLPRHLAAEDSLPGIWHNEAAEHAFASRLCWNSCKLRAQARLAAESVTETSSGCSISGAFDTFLPQSVSWAHGDGTSIDVVAR